MGMVSFVIVKDINAKQIPLACLNEMGKQNPVSVSAFGNDLFGSSDEPWIPRCLTIPDQ